jgi:acetoin utilization protein AcuB
MNRTRTIESAMTPFPYSIEADAHAATAKAMMAQFRVRHLPVREGERIVGLVTQWSLAQAERCGLDLSPGSALRVRDICSHDIHVVGPQEPLAEVLRRMAERHCDAALVVRDGRLVGIYTVTDACRQYAESLQTQRP